MRTLIVFILFFNVINYSEAFDPRKFLGKSEAKPENPNVVTSQDKASIQNLIQTYSSLSTENKMKLVEYRKQYKEALDSLIVIFERLPKEVQDALKYERTIRDSLSPKGKEELEQYIKGEKLTQ